MGKLKLLDTVALREAWREQGLPAGAVGTVVERLDDAHVEVEFADLDGVSYAELALPEEALLRLHHAPLSAAA